MQREGRVRAAKFSRLTWASRAQHQGPVNAGSLFSSTYPNDPLNRFPRSKSSQWASLGHLGQDRPPTSRGPHRWDAAPSPPQASAYSQLLREQDPAPRPATKTLGSFLGCLIKRRKQRAQSAGPQVRPPAGVTARRTEDRRLPTELPPEARWLPRPGSFV